jgi:glycosyltransferase involved in cell wall biosynthesis
MVMRVLFVAWRDLAHPQAGGSEYVVDRLAVGSAAQGHDVALLSGGPTGQRPYRVVDTGGTYTQYMRAPIEYLRRFRGWDLVVDVENGIPFFAPVWRRRPVICLVHHVHAEQWQLHFPRPVARMGRLLEEHAMAAVYRRSLFVAVSRSTAIALADLGIDEDCIRVVEMGCDRPSSVVAPAPEPTFLALGRLVPHKRIDLLLDLWRRVRPETGGTLIIVGDGPERARLGARAGAGVQFTGPVSASQKSELLGRAWLLVHPAMHEGWGTAILEAAAAGTPTLGFDVPGVRDSVRPRITGLLATTEDEFMRDWIALARDGAHRARLAEHARAWAAEHTWSRAVGEFLRIADDAIHRPAGGQQASETTASSPSQVAR